MLYLLGDWLIKKLLAHDCTLHGSVVREHFAGTDPLQFFDLKGVVVATAPRNAKNYLERALRTVMVVDPFVEEENLLGEQVVYTIDHLERHVTVRIFYKTQNVANCNFPRMDVDVNRLAMDRKSLYVMDTPGFEKEPAVLYELLVKCKKRQFDVLEPMVNPGWKIQRLKRLLKHGWVHEGGAVQVVRDYVEKKGDEQDKCAICQDVFSAKETNCRTRCGHEYHLRCWRKYVKTKRTSQQNLSSFLHPPTIECPLCRHEMEAFEAQI